MCNLYIHKIDKARKHTSTYGPSQYITPMKITRVRITKQHIQHFIEFISSLCYLQTVGFGSKILKLSSGIQVKVPKVIRTMIGSRLITVYTHIVKKTQFKCHSERHYLKSSKAAQHLNWWSRTRKGKWFDKTAKRIKKPPETWFSNPPDNNKYLYSICIEWKVLQPSTFRNLHSLWKHLPHQQFYCK